MALTTDVLGEPWTAETIHFPPDDQGPVVATLVVRRAETGTRKAVLQVHGFCDYFFQTDYAQWWVDRGYDFYALDLRRYGRSLLPHQLPNYVTDLSEHYAELDAAWHRITARDGHDEVVVSAHSTGGLTTSLWSDLRRPAELTALVLNSPWLDLQGSAVMRTIGTTALKRIAARAPHRIIPRKLEGYYARSLHRDHDGEWEFDLTWKPLDSYPVYVGWLAAIRRGHAQLQAGLDVQAPVLVLSSDRTTWPREMGEDVHSTDVVLDVKQIRRWATAIGAHVTYVAIPGARHDVVLSRSEPRAKVYDELDRWVSTYVDGPVEVAPSLP